MITDEYSVALGDNAYTSASLLRIFRHARKYFDREVWSARIGTGLLGLPNCRSGKRGPSGKGEVLFGLGNEGLLGIVSLGFIPCPTCQPEKTPGFNQTIAPAAEKRYNLTAKEFADKNRLPYDGRRVDWETIVSINGRLPSRIYVPLGLTINEQEEFANRIKRLGLLDSVAVGYYNHSVPDHFTEYFRSR